MLYLPKFEKITGKDELRSALMHVCISEDYTVATNAHILTWLKIDWPENFKRFIQQEEQIFIHGEQWKKIGRKEIDFVAVDKHALVFRDPKKGNKIFVEYTTKETAGFRYPEWKQVLPFELDYSDLETTEIPAIGVDFKLLNDIADCWNERTFRLDFFGQNRAILVRKMECNPVNQTTKIEDLTDSGSIIMPLTI